MVSVVVSAMSCDDTDRSEKERSWTLQAQNSTPHEVVIKLFSTDAALPPSFGVPPGVTVKLFDGLSGLLNLDPISAGRYDSAFMIFNQADTLKFYKNQAEKSILDREDYEVTKQEDDFTLYTYPITEEEYQLTQK